MTVSTVLNPPTSTDRVPPDGRALQVLLVAVIAVAVLVVAATGGYLVGHRHAGAATPTANSVDAGFVWDMSVHHNQAVTMAGYTRDHTAPGVINSSPSTSRPASSTRWADAGLAGRVGPAGEQPAPQMAWMVGSGHMDMQPDGLMPGMASPAEVTKLESLTGTPLEIYFLQLMLRHHQGGLPMAQWAAAHADRPYVRNAAEKMVEGQSAEIVLMEKLLRERGASPLAPPS